MSWHELERIIRCILEAADVRRVGLAATASYLPERWMTAAEVGERAGIPEQVIVEKFGLRGKHIAAPDEHVSDLSVKRGGAAARRRPASIRRTIDVVMYYGSMWRDYAVWQAAPHIAHRLGATKAFAVEYDNVSHGTTIALRVARDLLRAEAELKNVLVVAACRESYLIDYANERSRFMFNFGDGAVAGLLVGDPTGTRSSGARDHQRLVLAAGEGPRRRLRRPRGLPVPGRADPAAMKGGLDQESLPNFVAAARGAVERSGLDDRDLAFLCPLHTKRSMFLALLAELGMREDQAVYLDDTGHMSGVDPLLGLDRAVRDGRVRDGDAVLLLAAGTGYTWAAAVVRWGELA